MAKEKEDLIKPKYQIKETNYPFHPSLIISEESERLAEEMFNIGDALLKEYVPKYTGRIRKGKRKELISSLASYVDGYALTRDNNSKILQGIDKESQKIQTNIKATLTSIRKNIKEVLFNLGEKPLIIDSRKSESIEQIYQQKKSYNNTVRMNIFKEMNRLPSKVKDISSPELRLQDISLECLKLLEDTCRRLTEEKIEPARERDEINPTLVKHLVGLYQELTREPFKKTLDIEYNGKRGEFIAIGPRFIHALMLQINPDMTAETIRSILQKFKPAKKNNPAKQ